MPSTHNKGVLETGDHLTIKLDNGDQLRIMIYDNSVLVLSNSVGVGLDAVRATKFSFSLKYTLQEENDDINSN